MEEKRRRIPDHDILAELLCHTVDGGHATECLSEAVDSEDVIDAPGVVSEAVNAEDVGGCTPVLLSDDFCAGVGSVGPELTNLEAMVCSNNQLSHCQIDEYCDAFEGNSANVKEHSYYRSCTSKLPQYVGTGESSESDISGASTILDPDYQQPDISNKSSDEEGSQHQVEIETENLIDSTDEGQASNTPQESQAIKKGRKRTVDPSKWKRNVRIKSRVSGKSYVTRKGVAIPEKKPLPIDCTKCRFKCHEHFSEEQRAVICEEFYGLSNSYRQKDFICSTVTVNPKSRTRVRGPSPIKPKSHSYVFTFSIGEEKQRVCQQFFIRTISVSQKYVYSALSQKGASGSYTGSDGRIGKEPANKVPEDKLKHVREHINSFPKIDPHYCRRDSTLQYLSPELNIRKMYDLYATDYCARKGIAPVKEHKYREIFLTEFRLKCFVPKKDQCTLCNNYYSASDTEKDALKMKWQEHKEREKDAMEQKKTDKILATNDPSFLCISFDLQAVLYTPFAGDSLIFYKRKLAVYNFTIYESPSMDGHCYLWDETEGRRGASEISSCLTMYLNELPPNVKHITSYSDTCAGQNRNQFMAAAMLHCVQTHATLETVDMKYMESGHSYLEADSIHSTIENVRRHQKIYTPREWEIVILNARKKPRPYKVTRLDHTQFKDYKSLASSMITNRNKGKDGETVKWLSIKWLRFERSKPYTLQFKYRITDPDFKEIHVLSQKGRIRSMQSFEIKAMYNDRVPVSNAKKADLMSLLHNGVIPKEYTEYYTTIPSSARVRTQLPQPSLDEEDDDE